MAASNYSVNIKLDTKAARTELEKLEKRVNKLRRNLKTPVKIDSRAQIIEKQRLQNDDRRTRNAFITKRLKTQLNDLESRGLKLDKLRKSLRQGAFLNQQQRFIAAESINKTIAKELDLEQKKLKENIKNAGVDNNRVKTLQQIIGLKRTEAALNRTSGRTAAFMDSQRRGVGPNNLLGLPSTEMLKPSTRGIKILDLGTQGRQQTSVPFGPQIATAKQLEQFGTGASAMSIDSRFAQQRRRLKFQFDLNMLELKGVKTTKLRAKMGELVDAQNRKQFGSIQRINNELTNGITKEQNRLKLIQEQNKTRKRGASFKFPMGASSPLNFGPDGQLLPGPARGRGFDFQSALISGGFPLLFGQGPFVGAAGALGGGIGGSFGQMGGFAGGIAATTIAQTIQSFTVETGKLGAALNDATKDVEAVSAALGITGTEFEKNLKTLQKLGDEEAAFEAARQKMINLVGKEGVDALQRFGKGTTELANQFTIAMTQMRAGFASFLKSSGLGAGLLRTVSNANLMRQAEVSDDLETQKLLKARDLLMKAPFFRSEEEKALLAEFPGITSANQARDAIFERQRTVNKNNEEAAVEKLLADIQKQRVKNITDEIVLLEKSFGLTSDEFEIEKQIMQMKQDGEIKDEAEIRNKLKHLQNLQKERQLADETAAAFERMAQTIATDLSQGIQGMIRGTSTLSDLLSNVINKISTAFFNRALFGNIQGDLNKGKGIFGNLFGGFLANGGPAMAGKSYMVGEKGPELFTPSVSGKVTSNSALKGSTNNVVVNVNLSTGRSEMSGGNSNARRLGEEIGVAVQAEIRRQQRSGGLLA